MKRNNALLIALALFFACQPIAYGATTQTEYIIGEGDLLRITVYDNPDLTLETRVTAEGSITFPLIGSVLLKDLTAPEAEKKIAGLLADGYIIKPQVSVFIEESKASFVYVNGEVKNPGAYRITKGMTVLKAITIAGGITPKAGESRVKIIRKTEKGELTLKAKMDDLVLPDDVIYVPESMF
jgi:protein involved in polysaccharide export with SLBB domain